MQDRLLAFPSCHNRVLSLMDSWMADEKGASALVLALSEQRVNMLSQQDVLRFLYRLLDHSPSFLKQYWFSIDKIARSCISDENAMHIFLNLLYNAISPTPSPVRSRLPPTPTPSLLHDSSISAPPALSSSSRCPLFLLLFLVLGSVVLTVVLTLRMAPSAVQATPTMPAMPAMPASRTSLGVPGTRSRRSVNYDMMPEPELEAIVIDVEAPKAPSIMQMEEGPKSSLQSGSGDTSGVVMREEENAFVIEEVDSDAMEVEDDTIAIGVDSDGPSFFSTTLCIVLALGCSFRSVLLLAAAMMCWRWNQPAPVVPIDNPYVTPVKEHSTGMPQQTIRVDTIPRYQDSIQFTREKTPNFFSTMKQM